MGFLATSTILGTLEVLEVYVQYNGPRLLACKNQANKIFLTLWVDEEEDLDLWLYMFVSLNRLQEVRTGQISLYEAFSKPESSYLYEITFTHANAEWYARQVTPSELDEDCLPARDTFLNCEAESLPQIEFQEIIHNAVTKTREIVHLVLEPSSNYPNEFPAFESGKILSTFQPLIRQLNILKNSEQFLKSRDISKKSEFNVFATSPGSFQVELASSVFESDIFGNSLAGDAVEKLLQLIRIASCKLLPCFRETLC